MAPLPIIESEVPIQVGPRRDHGIVGVQINLLVLHTPPQPLDEDIVEQAPLAVHVDRHTRILEHVGEHATGELRSSAMGGRAI